MLTDFFFNSGNFNYYVRAAAAAYFCDSVFCRASRRADDGHRLNRFKI